MRKLLLFATAAILVTSCGKPSKGASGIDGLNGTPGTNGIDGAKGDKGDTGAIGEQGEQGAPGVAGVTSIKFCPNLVDRYGQAYSEYGFCIDNKVYAVYWSGKEAFMTELSNGNYRTTTSFGNCNFTVNNNCNVTH